MVIKWPWSKPDPILPKPDPNANLSQYGYGSTYGQNFTGGAAVYQSVPTPPGHSPLTFSHEQPGQIPIFLTRYNKQTLPMRVPRAVFVTTASLWNPDWNPHNVDNRPIRNTELVFQSPLEFIGDPTQ